MIFILFRIYTYIFTVWVNVQHNKMTCNTIILNNDCGSAEFFIYGWEYNYVSQYVNWQDHDSDLTLSFVTRMDLKLIWMDEFVGWLHSVNLLLTCHGYMFYIWPRSNLNNWIKTSKPGRTRLSCIYIFGLTKFRFTSHIARDIDYKHPVTFAISRQIIQ